MSMNYKLLNAVSLHHLSQVHHKDYDKENNKEDNLICLCRKCNMKVNKNREYWENYFENIIKNAKHVAHI